MNQQLHSPPNLFLEDLLPKTGWGLYYNFMFAMACANSFTNGAAFTSLPYAIPLSTCETFLSSNILFGVYISFLLGKASGGYVITCSSDVFGRKRLLTYTLLTIFMTTFTAAFAYSYYMVVIAAFFLGGSVESHGCIVKIHLAEILPKNKRGFYLAACDVSWTLGYLAMSAFAVTMQRSSFVEHRTVDMKLATWRAVLALAGGFSLMLACCSALLEESPRYFLHSKKEYLAVLALKQFYAINRSSYGNAFEVKDQDVRYFVQDYGLTSVPDGVGGCGAVTSAVKVICKATKLTMSDGFRRSTVTLSLVKIPLTVFGLVYMNVVLAKVLSGLEVANGLGVVYLEYVGDETMCSSFEDNKTLYGNFFVLVMNIILGRVLMLWCLDKVGRRFSLVVPLVLAGLSLVSLDFIEDNMIRMVVCSVVILSVASATTAVAVIGVEVFPTGIRGTSHGVTNFLATLLTIFFVRFFDLFAKWWFMIGGGMFIVASLVANCVADLKQQPMVE